MVHTGCYPFLSQCLPQAQIRYLGLPPSAQELAHQHAVISQAFGTALSYRDQVRLADEYVVGSTIEGRFADIRRGRDRLDGSRSSAIPLFSSGFGEVVAGGTRRRSDLGQQNCRSGPSDWDVQTYVARNLLQRGWARELFFDVYQFRGDEQVLDIGCGDGGLTQLIALNVPRGRVVGIDNSPYMVAYAQQHNQGMVGEDGQRNIKYVYADAQDPSVYDGFDGQFDIVVSFTAMHWMPQQLSVLQSIAQVLKPDGRFFIRLCSRGGDPIQDIADQLMRESPFDIHFGAFVDPMTRFSPSEYLGLLAQAGLRIDRLLDAHKEDRLKGGRAALINQVKGWLPHYRYLKQYYEELAEDFIKILADRYLAHYPPDKDGVVTLHDSYLEMRGRKQGYQSKP